MPLVTADPLPAGPKGRKRTADAPSVKRPRSEGLRAQFLWLLLIVKMFCLQNMNWILSAVLHGSLMASVAGLALHHNRGGFGDGSGIESGVFDGQGEQSFENVLGSDTLEMGGGGAPLDTAMQSVEMMREAQSLAALTDEARLGMAGAARGDGGEGGGSGGGSGGGNGPGVGLGAGFFGSKGTGRSFVYVVDMSGSMHGRRFDRAKSELARSINKLNPEQKFYVFFFNDRTFPLFDPKPAKGLIPANPTNKQRASAWIRKREAESTTNPNFALQQALEMHPDVIFLLTDGELDDPQAARRLIRQYNTSNVVIHTIAFDNEEAGETLKSIAEDNQGTYRFVR
jgi:hypothetical protein